MPGLASTQAPRLAAGEPAAFQPAPHELTLELVRADSAHDPHGFRFVEQTYLLRQGGGEYGSAVFPWSKALLADLDALRAARPAAETRQRMGELLRTFLEPAGWSEHERTLLAALAGGRPVHITLRFAAAELHALPWELLALRTNGRHLGALNDCLLRYEWPETTTATPALEPLPAGGRILVAWSAAGGAVPAGAHVAAIREACRRGYHDFSRQDVLPHVSLRNLRAALAAPGAPVSVLHILCHGGSLPGTGQGFGLVWNAAEPAAAADLFTGPQGMVMGHDVIDANALREVLAPHLGTLRLVVLCACDSGHAGTPGSTLGSVAQALHRIGIPAVVSSRLPLSTQGSTVLTRILYERLLVDLRSLEDAFLAAREELETEGRGLDWAALQFHARASDGPDHRPVIFRPYRGLSAFEADSRRFFMGREQEVEQLVDVLRSGQRLLAVVGASGSGKSSLVRAGLVPRVLAGALGPGTIETRILHPGNRPCQALAVALAAQERAANLLDSGVQRSHAEPLRHTLLASPDALTKYVGLARMPGERLLLVVDQFEELFTHAEDPAEATAFVANLLHATARPEGYDGCDVYVVLTLRTDFLGKCLELDRNLAERLDAARQTIWPMDEHQLRAAIELPALRVGLRVDPAVVDALLAEVRVDPALAAAGQTAASNLPLLEFALEGLWERRQGSVMSWAAWQSIGHLRGAIAQRADQVLAGCVTDEQRRLARDLFRRLVQPGQGIEDTRRHVMRAGLESLAPGKAGPELQRWIAARLLTADADEVWIAHEAVIREWGTLREWLREDREALQMQEDLSRAAQRWQEQGRSADELWRGGRLRRAMELRHAGRLRLEAGESAFLDAAEALQRAEVEAAVARRLRALARARGDRRRARVLAFAAVLVTLVMSGLASWAWVQWREAELQRKEAQHQRIIAEEGASLARDFSLMAGARELLARGQPAWGAKLLLAIERPHETRGWMSLALELLPKIRLVSTLRGHTKPVVTAAFSPDGARVVTASSDGTVRVWRADGQGEPVVLRHEGGVWSAAFSPDGARVVTASSDGTVRVWHADGQGEPVVLRHGHEVVSAQLSANGRHVVTTSRDGAARVWCADGQGAPVVLRHGDEVVSAQLSTDGRQVVTASMDGAARVWRADGQGEPVVFQHEDEVVSAQLSADGRHVVTASRDGTARVWRTGGQSQPVVLRHDDELRFVALDADGSRVVTVSDGAARVWRANGSGDGQGEPVVLRHEGEIVSAQLSADGTRVVTISAAGAVYVWRADGQGTPVVLAHEDGVWSAALSADGQHVVTASIDGAARVWRADGQGAPVVLRHQNGVWSAAFSADGQHVVTVSMDGTARVWRANGSGDGQGAPVVLRHEEGILSAALSTDGARVVTVASDGAVRVWRANGSGDGQGAPVVLRHEGRVWSAALSTDGTRVVTVASDGTVRVWRADGQGAPVVLRHEGRVWSAALSADGTCVVTASADGMARVWTVELGRLTGFLRQANTDCLPPELREIYLGESAHGARTQYEACERAYGRTPFQP